MPDLKVHDLPAEVIDGLRIRAAQAGRSLESEARAILAKACGPALPPLSAEDLRAQVRKAFGGLPPAGAVDRLLADRRAAAEVEEREDQGA